MKKPKKKSKSQKKGRADYKQYLLSASWKRKRERMFAVRGRQCERCKAKASDGAVLHIHHLTYVRIFKERPEDLMILCHPCHEKEHGRKFSTRNKNVPKKVVAHLLQETDSDINNYKPKTNDRTKRNRNDLTQRRSG